MRTQPSHNRAFSLLELLVVILIIGIVAVFVAPAVTTVLRGSQLTQAEQILTDQLKLARQTAVSKNHSVQVRFIRFGDPDAPGEKATDLKTGAFRAIQLFETLDNGVLVPVGKLQMLPQSIVMNSSQLSTVINPTKSATVTTIAAKKTLSTTDDTGGDPALPKGVDWNYDFVAFRYLPDGSTNLMSTTIWSITLHNINEKLTGASLPPNFVTLQIDPVGGSVRVFRPSV